MESSLGAQHGRDFLPIQASKSGCKKAADRQHMTMEEPSYPIVLDKKEPITHEAKRETYIGKSLYLDQRSRL